MSDSLPTEVFRPVPRFPAYRVSDHGNVQTCYCPNGWTGMTDIWRPLKGYLDRNGYHMVDLYRDGKRFKRGVHCLVLEAFVGPCPSGMEVRHVHHNDRTNNRLENLAWGTVQDNADDRARHGTQVRGETCKQAKMTEAKVIELRRLRAEGWTFARLARRFGVNLRNAIRIAQGETWAHVRAEEGKRLG